MALQDTYETWKGEGMKTMAEASLHQASRTMIGRMALEKYAFGSEGRIVDEALHTMVAGIEFENPVHVGAGWDKIGRAMKGLYQVGFGGGTIGTVLPFYQRGKEKPRLWTINAEHSVGFNCMGFNSRGMDGVEAYFEEAFPWPCPVGLSVGRNMIMDNDMAVWAHDQVIRRLGKYVRYIELGISTPNTEDVRLLQQKEFFRRVVGSAIQTGGDLPVFAKIDSERSQAELDDMIEVALEEGLTGFVATNTYAGKDIKARYGQRWADKQGGLSGDDPEYRARATATVRNIYEAAGDKLAVIGVGGVKDADTALEKIKAGASAVQIVTAIRPSLGRVAAQVNSGLLLRMKAEGVSNIRDYIGLNTARGPLAA